MPNKALISYSRSDQVEVRALARALRQAGVRPWRDEDDLPLGARTEEEVRRAVREECDGAVLWLSSSAIESDFVMDIELPEILSKSAAGGFPFVPVFRGMPPTQAAARVRDRTGREVGTYNGEVLIKDEEVPGAVRRVASRFVAARMGPVGSRSSEPRPTIRVVTRADTAGAVDEAILDFDWRHLYTSGLPDPIAQLEVKQALQGSIEALLAAWGPGDVRIDAKVHLSVAVALGHALRRPTGAIPVVLHEGQEWPAVVEAAGGPALQESLEGGPVGGEELAVELSVSQDVGPGVDALVAKRGAFRGRLRFVAPDGVGPAVLKTPEQANSWADQVTSRLTAVRGESRASSVALFMAGPLPLAVLLGWRLNAVGPVTVYEWSGNTGPYLPGWALP